MTIEHQSDINNLIEGCKKNNRKSQETLYNYFSGKMLGVCARYARDRFEAEDMLQTGFVKMFEKINSFKGEGSFEGWLRRIMVNNAIEFYRRNLRLLPIIDIEEANTEAAFTMPSSTPEVKDLLKIIQQLAPGYRVIFNMYAIEGYSHKEISEQLGISEGTSKSQLSRARIILQELVNQMEGTKNETMVR